VSSRRAKRPHKGLDGAARSPTIEPRDVRLLVTAAEAVRVFPFAGLSTAGANGGPGVSRKAFEDHLRGREACLLEAFEQVLALAAERASTAYEAQEGWLDRVRAGVVALLAFFDEEPELARFLVVHSAHAGPAVLARRGEVLDRLAGVLDDEHAPARRDAQPFAAQAAVSGVLGVVHGRLSTPNPGLLTGLADPLTSLIVLPFGGEHAARTQHSRPVDEAPAPPKRSVALDLMMRSGGPLGDRAIAILRVIGAEPGLSNRQVGDRVGVKGQVHISRLLARLLSRGLIENTCDAPGVENEWQLTATGEEVERAIWAETPAAERSVALALMLGSGGPLSDRAISVLRLIGAEPGLNNRGVTRRVGLKDRTYVAKVLADLAARELIENTRRGGRANAWQLTAAGEQLERAIWAESSATMQLSIARDLLRDPDGRLDEHVVSVLALIGSEPGLSDIEIALRTGVDGHEHASRLLARLARFSLIETTDVHARKNAWQHTANGRALAQGRPDAMVPREAPSPSRGVALDLIREFGGLITQRAVSALRVIERQPGLGSRDIARRIGVTTESHVHELFALLAKHELAKNVRAGGRDNAWQLTVGGQELQSVLWGKASPALQRSVAVDLMRDFGGGPSKSLAAVLRLIAAEPGLGNFQITERVGISEGHTSNLLSRLTRFGLIENAKTGRDSDWQPTVAGSELMRAILHQNPDAARGGGSVIPSTGKSVCASS
jgi:DNA-binding MarR family transcriptional regulator/AcrR family transcriptional regulator